MDYSKAQQASRGAEIIAVPQPIPGAINGLAEMTSRLHERIHHLAERLEPILAPVPVSSVERAEPPAGKLARHSLKLQIESEAALVSGAADRLDALISRLEL